MNTQKGERRRASNNEETVMDLVQNYPGTRAMASLIGISHLSVWRILRTNDMHHFNIQRVQLDENNFAP